MLNFHLIRKSDIEAIRRAYSSPSALGCESNAVSAYLWSREYGLKIAYFGDSVIKAYYRDKGSLWGYCLPRGGDVAAAVRAVIAYSEEKGESAVFDYMTAGEKETLQTLFPGSFSYSAQNDTCDYIYNTSDLAELSGKKYHAKRNHISRFYRTYNDTRLAEITEAVIPDALRVVRRWYRENGIDHETYGEYSVIQNALAGLGEYNMRGLVLYAGDEPAAMTLGCELSPLCFDVMFEKALRSFEGSYAVINNEFAKTLTRYRFLNREEDLGLEGLRKAKLSYHPAVIYERWRAELI